MLLNPYVFTTGVGVGGGPSYFFEERFEGTGYQRTWAESGTGTINEDYTTSPLEGSQSLLISASTQRPNTTTTFSSDVGEIWGYFKIRIDTALSVTRNIVVIRNSSTTTVFAIGLVTDNGLTVTNGTSTSPATTTKMTAATNYNLWFHWAKGSGTNGTASVAWDATGTEPTSGNQFRSLSNGNSTTDAHDFSFRFSTAADTNGALVLDQLLISTTGTIGNSPA